MISDERLREYAERILLLDYTDWSADVEAAVEILRGFCGTVVQFWLEMRTHQGQGRVSAESFLIYTSFRLLQTLTNDMALTFSGLLD